MKINEFEDKTQETVVALVQDCKRCVNNQGKPYLTLILADSTGTMDARKWDVMADDEKLLEKGAVISAMVVANLYDKKLQGKILGFKRLSMEEVNLDDLVAQAPVEVTSLHNRCKAYIASIKDPVVGDLLKAIFRKYYKRYRDWPAAASNHHNYLHGLLYHSVTMADLADTLAKIYPVLNRDVLIAGTLLHDIGKSIELSGPVATSYTLEGKLVGHLVLGQDIVREAATELGYFAYDDLSEEEKLDKESEAFHKKEIAVIFEHIIISHHSQPEFGAAVRPLTRESQIIAMIEDIDAKMMILSKAYEGISKGDFTAKIYSMDNRYFYKPMYTENEEVPFGLNDEVE